MYTCIILRNVIFKDQNFAICEFNELYISPHRNIKRTWIKKCIVQWRKAKELGDKQTQETLQQNLMEHIWQRHQQQI
jgi:hypothetical protein